MDAQLKVFKLILGEIVPIRMYLKAFDLTPSYNKIGNKFSVKYFLNIVLIDNEDRRYFKQQEIMFYRKRWNYNKLILLLFLLIYNNHL